MGTSGTMTGTGLAIKKLQPHVHRVGVTTQPGDRVPGPRSEALLAPVTFPWRDSIDAMEWVGSRDAYTLSLKLCRHGLLVGPSSASICKDYCSTWADTKKRDDSTCCATRRAEMG